jgi:hypothetical protein
LFKQEIYFKRGRPLEIGINAGTIVGYHMKSMDCNYLYCIKYIPHNPPSKKILSGGHSKTSMASTGVRGH